MFEKIKELIVESLGIEEDQVTMEASFKEDLKVDSLDLFEMVMGLEEAERFANAHPDLDACFIYTDDKGEFQMFYTKGMSKYITGK